MLTELCWAITQSDISIEKTESLIKKLLTILQSKLDETWPESAIILLSKSYCLGCALKKFVYFNEIVDSIANIAIKNNYSLGKALIVAKSLCLIVSIQV